MWERERECAKVWVVWGWWVQNAAQTSEGYVICIQIEGLIKMTLICEYMHLECEYRTSHAYVRIYVHRDDLSVWDAHRNLCRLPCLCVCVSPNVITLLFSPISQQNSQHHPRSPPHPTLIKPLEPQRPLALYTTLFVRHSAGSAHSAHIKACKFCLHRVHRRGVLVMGLERLKIRRNPLARAIIRHNVCHSNICA